MDLEMYVTNVTQPVPDPALTYIPPAEGAGAVRPGRQPVGTVVYAPEKLCAPHCYTGLDIDSPEGVLWMSRGSANTVESLEADASLLRMRFGRFLRLPPARNLTLHLHTTQVLQTAVSGAARLRWPRLSGAGRREAGEPSQPGEPTAVGAVRRLRVLARNPSHSHALLLQPVLQHDLHLPPECVH
ncbi:unnamed protein product [Parnassius apollo]|uniref:(apollo) hypothetical protein n=1 Tax=Parnassius apollo TaxID=110799 RepID=A0A8S3XMS6_PARAO|nr:unnamed protein product [Parnassius apollo]